MNKRLLYHGSYIKVEHPLVYVGRQDLDFGRGFYTTDLREQAVKWARIIQQRRNTSAKPILNIYEIDMDVVEEKGFKQLYFEKYDLDWLVMYNKPNNQICILNQKIIDKCVRFVGAEIINF